MTLTLILEQAFNGLQAGVTLFLVAAGLTLILGIMDVVFLAHGAQVMIGAYAAAAITGATGNFYIGLLLAIPVTLASGYLLEFLLIRFGQVDVKEALIFYTFRVLQLNHT